MRRVSRNGTWVLVLVGLIAAWQAYVRLRGVPQYVLPAPTDVARALWDERGPLASAAGVTAREMLAGFAVALAFGFAAAVALHASATLRRAVYPLLVASQSVPVVAIAPLLVIYLGFGLAPKLVIVALVCFFPITVVGPRRVPVGRPRPRPRDAHAAGDAGLPSSAGWSCPGRCRRSSPACGWPPPTPRSRRSSPSTRPPTPGLGNAMREGTAQYDAPLVGAAVVVLAALALALFGARDAWSSA